MLVRKNRIAEVGRWSALKSRGGPRLDLGEVLLTPGLINAHCHLDYTDMAGLVPSTKLFTDWLKLIVTAKGQWTDSDYAASWRKGAAMLVATGATTVADIEALPELLPAAWLATPLRVISFLEMIALTGRRPAREIVDGMVARVKSLSHPRCRAGLSPHAPYSTVPELLRLCARAARRHRLRICTHIAESDLEFEMFARADGEMYRWLSKSSRDMADCGLGSPVAHMRRSGALGKNLLGVHLNYLGRGDALALAENCVSVVHCPRSHAFFRHAPFPLRRLQR
ncbi:MAG TPA: amidohydrolase family protein, partial [Verrucomicrobiae bacterium]|nr:amidohydrolase family protein [Verrucomicrobiae bacterium]